MPWLIAISLLHPGHTFQVETGTELIGVDEGSAGRTQQLITKRMFGAERRGCDGATCPFTLHLRPQIRRDGNPLPLLDLNKTPSVPDKKEFFRPVT